MVPRPCTVRIQDDIAVSRVELALLLIGHLQQVEIVHPEYLLGTIAVVDHPAVGSHRRMLVQRLRVELSLDDLSDAAVAWSVKNMFEM